jgi:hypothetical protein
MNLMSLLLSIVSNLPRTILDVETLFGAKTGEIKLAAVVDVASNTAVVAGVDPTIVQTVVAATTSITNSIVSVLNSAGVFKHSNPAPVE